MYISDPCARYGSANGCDSDCPVLNDGDCSIEEELAYETDWYVEWAIDSGWPKSLSIVESFEQRQKPKQPSVVDNFDRAMGILNNK